MGSATQAVVVPVEVAGRASMVSGGSDGNLDAGDWKETSVCYWYPIHQGKNLGMGTGTCERKVKQLGAVDDAEKILLREENAALKEEVVMLKAEIKEMTRKQSAQLQQKRRKK